MAVITLASATGAPGVTTSALALANSWPREVVVVDADRDAGQPIAAGYLHGIDLGGRGLSSLARAHREQSDLAEQLPMHWVDVPGERMCHIVPGHLHPGAGALFAPVWPDLMAALAALGSQGVDVLVDAGRAREGLPASLVVGSDLVLLVVRSSLRALAALRLHLPVVQGQLEGCGAELGLLVVGPGRPYGTSEIERQFDVPVLATMAWEPRQAEVFSDGAVPARGMGTTIFVRSARTAASSLAERVRRRAEVVAGARVSADWERR